MAGMTLTLTHRLRPENLAGADYSLPEYMPAQVPNLGIDY